MPMLTRLRAAGGAVRARLAATRLGARYLRLVDEVAVDMAEVSPPPRAWGQPVLAEAGGTRLGYLESCLLHLCRYHDIGTGRAAVMADTSGDRCDLDIAAFLAKAEDLGLVARACAVPLERLGSAPLPAVVMLDGQRAALLLARTRGGFEMIDPDHGDQPVEIGFAQLAAGYQGHAILVARAPRRNVGVERDEAGASDHWFWGAIARNRALYGQIVLAAFVSNILGLLAAIFSMVVYDRIIPNAATESLIALTTGVVVALGFDFVIRMLRAAFIDRAGERADLIMGRRIFDQLLNLQMKARKGSTGAMASRLREFESLRDFFTSASLVALVDLPFVLLFLFVIYWVAGPLVLVPLVLIPAVVISGALLQPFMARLATTMHAEGMTKQGVLVEAVSGIEAIKVTGAASLMRERWEESLRHQSAVGLKTRLFGQLAFNIAGSAQQMAQILTVFFGVFLIGDNALSMGGLIAAVLLGGRAMAPLGQLAQILARFNHAVTAYRSIDALMRAPTDKAATRTYLSRPRIKGDIQFSGVRFRYPDQSEPALDGVSFAIKPGEKVAILGKVGSGKTTVAKLLLGLYEPDEGAIRLDQTDLRQIDPLDLRGNIGPVLQDVWLFSGSVRRNIAIGATRPNDAEILRAAEAAGVHDFVREMPGGYDVVLRERGEGLSGGQRQAITIARALVGDPGILVMDEPTSMMDPASEQRLIARLKDELAEKTLIVITHRTSLLALVDRVIVMDRGRIVADGPKAILERRAAKATEPEMTSWQ
ncbi:ATP-binding cassette, subfamily C, LapB [Sphingomonas laterariae]|uniref:ATP-binding cassette, subfamily C, LapB n=2 Tax=Edaphosphingomonas laterariae TaxID=861865 RepID=A0A239HH39_9SPHN|nr:ATP-binding cassette, subfamily C, LapB [Sphingomonas laterariae]